MNIKRGFNLAKKPSRKKIFKLAGESQINLDGKSRQDILAIAMPGVDVILQREPTNKYDANAIRALIGDDVIGYLTKEDAEELFSSLDMGREHKAILHKLSGGTPDSPSYGAEISISWDGEESYPYKPLWDMQIYYREVTLPARLKAKLAKRDSGGKFASSTRKTGSSSKNGCLPIIVLGFGMSFLLMFGLVK